MAIAFEKETGTGSSTATSYADVADFRQYWDNRGVDYSTIVDDTVKAWLNNATEYLDNTYNFEGEPSNDDQALAWPRTGVTNRYNEDIAYDVIPIEVINSTCYMAAQVSQGSLFVIDEGIKSESYGPVSKTYSGVAGSKSYSYVDGQLKWYIIQGNNLIRVN